jgi:O-antigen/teichoic acid export membrane protein
MRQLLSAATKTISGTLATLFSAAVCLKVLALSVGPEGVGLFSLLRQFQNTASLAGSFGGQTGLVQGLSASSDADRKAYLGTATRFFIISTFLLWACLVLFASPIASVLGIADVGGAALVRLLSLPVVLGACVAYFLGVLNGHRAIGAFAWLQILVGFGLAVGSFPAARMYRAGNRSGLVWLLAGSLLLGVLFGWWQTARRGLLHGALAGFDRRMASQFAAVSGTTLLTSLFATAAGVAVRSMTIHALGLPAGGIIDVAWTLSMVYVMLVLSSLNTYYLPVLSGTRDAAAQAIHVRQTLRFSFAAILPLVTAVIVLKPFIVKLLYSAGFLPALVIVRWMFIGDYLKVASWVLAMPMIANARMRAFFWAELFANLLLVTLTGWAVLVRKDLESAGIAFVIVYVVYLSWVGWYLLRRLQIPLQRRDAMPWLIGLGYIVFLSLLTWSDQIVQWSLTIVAILAAVIIAALSMSREERRTLVAFALRRTEVAGR